MPAVLDIQAYIDAGAVAPALEFLSPIKGPAPRSSSPWKSGPACPMLPMRRPSTTRTSSLRPSNLACLVGEPAH